MADIFKEQIVKKNITSKDETKRVIIIAITAFLCLASLFFFGLAISVIVIFVLILIATALINRLNVEFEYACTNGTFDVDSIYNKTKRKNVLSIQLSEVEVMAHIDDKAHLAEYENLPVMDFSSGEILGNTYVFVVNKRKFIIEPNDEMLDCLNLTLTPRKLFRKNS